MTHGHPNVKFAKNNIVHIRTWISGVVKIIYIFKTIMYASGFILLLSHWTPYLSCHDQLQVYLDILKLILNLCGRLLFIDTRKFVLYVLFVFSYNMGW